MGARFGTALLAVMLLSGCDQPINQHVEWPPGADWGEYGAAHCPAQCEQLARLSCPKAQPTPGGITCPDSCRALLERKVWKPEDVACVEGAKDVDGVRTCRVRCRK